jgi:hypothetical protein
MIERLIQILRNAGLEPTPIEVAEFLILAAHIPPLSPKAVEDDRADLPERVTDGSASDSPSARSKSSDTRQQSTSDSNQNADGGLFPDNPDDSLSGESGGRAIPFRTPKAPALPGANKIARALRPLRRSFPSNRRFVLDEEKTVQQIADGGPKSPVMKPESERWLDVALVFDDSLTMQVWRSTLVALQRLFERSGIFRNHRSWIINTEAETPTLHLATSAGPSSQKISTGVAPEIRSPRELLDSSGRRLIIVVSDCHALSWHSGNAYRLIAEWGIKTPVALVQILPQRFWPGTTMTPVDASLRAYLPGTTNRRLEINPAWYREVIEAGGIALPVVSLEEWSISSWAKMVAGSSGVTATGLIIPPLPAINAQQDLSPQTGYEPAGDRAAEKNEQSEEQPSISAKARVNEFFTNATPLAQQLACYLASAPLTLPVMQLVQQAMLPQSRQSHLAEFFLGGLIYQPRSSPGRKQAPDEIIFEFYQGVRDELINRVTKYETVRVITAVSRYIEQRLGEAGEFGALLALPGASSGNATRRIDPLSRRFAELSGRILRRFGGYDNYIEQIEKRIPLTPVSSQAEDTVELDEQDQQVSVESLMGQANSLMSQGKLKQAEPLYQRVIGIINAYSLAWQGLAVIARQGIAGEETMRLLSRNLRGSLNVYARWSAAKAIGDAGINSPELINALLQALSDQSDLVRSAVAESLGKIGGVTAEILQGLARALNDNSRQVRSNAAVALGNIGDRSSIPALSRVLEDQDGLVRIAATEAIEKLGATGRAEVEKARVFISYASEDRQWVEQIYSRLLKEGFDPWMDIFKLDPGMEWRREGEKAINEADIVLFCLSTNAVSRSGFFHAEIKFALEKAERLSSHLPLILVRLEECIIPEALSSFQSIDLFESDGWSQLIQIIASSKQKKLRASDDPSISKLEKYISLLIWQLNAIRNELLIISDATTRIKLEEKSREIEKQIKDAEAKLYQLRNSSRPELGGQISIYDLAGELKLEFPEVIEEANRLGARVSVESETLSPEVADQIRARLAKKSPDVVRSRGYQYACYICCEAREEVVQNFAADFQAALSIELKLKTTIDKPVFFEQSHSRAMAFPESRVRAMYQSACYIVLCTPTLFSSPFHQRELEAVRRLEDARRRLSGKFFNPHRLILPVFLRGRESVPGYLREIQWIDLSEVALSGSRWLRTRRGEDQIRQIADYVHRCCAEAERTPEAFDNWQEFTLPSADEIPISEYTLPLSYSDTLENESEAKVRDLARQYEKLRETLPSGFERTRLMGRVVEEMKSLAPSIHSLLSVLANSESAGERLAAITILQEAPDPEYLDWLAARLNVEKPFMGFQATLALLSAVRLLSKEFYPRISAAISIARHNLGPDRERTDRFKTLDEADRELRRNWSSRYFNPPEKIRTIGRQLKTGTYTELVDQLKEGEVLMGLFVNQSNALVATHIQTLTRMNEMEELFYQGEYFAVPVDAANEGMGDAIPPQEAKRENSSEN